MHHQVIIINIPGRSGLPVRLAATAEGVERQCADQAFAVVRSPTDGLIEQGGAVDADLHPAVVVAARVAFDVHVYIVSGAFADAARRGIRLAKSFTVLARLIAVVHVRLEEYAACIGLVPHKA